MKLTKNLKKDSMILDYYIFTDKYNNIYKLPPVTSEEYLEEHITYLIQDTPHQFPNEIKNLAKSCIYNKHNLSYNLYKNNKLIAFIYGYYVFSIYTVKLLWFNNMKNSLLLLSLLKKYYMNPLVKIVIDRPYKEAKWYLFDNFFNNTTHNNFITHININNNTIIKSNQLLETYGVKLWDNTVV